MPTAAVGSVSVTKDLLRTQLADCSTFRTLCSAADRAGALEHIYLDSLPLATGDEYTLAELQAIRPLAVISLVDRSSDPQGVNADGGISFRRTYMHSIRIERNVPSDIAADEAEVNMTWDNIWGSIMDEIEALSGKAGYLACQVQRSDGPYRTHPSDYEGVGDAQQVTLETTTVD